MVGDSGEGAAARSSPIGAASRRLRRSGDDDSGAGDGGGLDEITAGWVWYGPIDDTGWNVANEAGQQAAQDALGDSLTQLDADNVPYTDEAAPVFEQFVTTQSANVLVDAVGYGDIFTDVCNKHPDIYCIQTAPFTAGQEHDGMVPEALDHRVHGRGRRRAQHEERHCRLRARLQAAVDHRRGEPVHSRLPQRQPAVCARTVVTQRLPCNPWTSQAVSTCSTRAPTWSGPTRTTRATARSSSEGDALAIGEFWTNGEQCGENALVSTVWDFNQYYVDQFEAIQNGDFVSRQLEFLDPNFLPVRGLGSERSRGRPDPGRADLRRPRLRRREPVRRPDQGQHGQGSGTVRRGAERQVPLRRVGLVRRRDPGGLSSRETGQHAAGRRA